MEKVKAKNRCSEADARIIITKIVDAVGKSNMI